MKKIILIAAMVLGFAVAASAQPRALGARLGNGVELSYQHNVGSVNFVQADLGLAFGLIKDMNLSATYNWMIAQPDWTSQGEWGFYAGPGAAVGLGDSYFHVALTGQVGLEYTFDFPLQLSIDLKPFIGPSFGNGLYYNVFGGLGIRYRF